MSTVSVERSDVGEDRPGRVECPECGADLALHQPDERRPDRLLATCRSCGCWFVTTDGLRSFNRLPTP